MAFQLHSDPEMQADVDFALSLVCPHSLPENGIGKDALAILLKTIQAGSSIKELK